MSENLQLLLQEALNNNSYDHDKLNLQLKKTWENSYSYLYSLQKAYTEYEELFYYSNDKISHNSKVMGKLYVDRLNTACFDVDYDLIHVANREEYRLSDYYNKMFTTSDIISHPLIFNKLPVVLIDDQVIWDYKMRVDKDVTTFILPFKRKFVVDLSRNSETDEIIYLDHKIQVFVVDNIYYERLTLNKTNVMFNAITKTITIDKSYLTDVPDCDGTMFCSIHIPNAVGKGYELGTVLIPLQSGTSAYTGRLSNDLVQTINSCGTNFYVSMVFFKRLYQHTFYTGNTTTVSDGKETNLMVIQKDEMVPYSTPIPVEDFFIMKKSASGGGWYVVKNTEVLEMYYPNIYRIIDPDMVDGDAYRIYYFYYNITTLQYTPIHDFYYKYLVDKFDMPIEEVVDKIYRNVMPYHKMTEEQIASLKATFTKILNYGYHKYNYGEIDFLDRYLAEENNTGKEPIEYKIDTMNEWIKVEPQTLNEYVTIQKDVGQSYFMYTNTIDLSTRERTDTSVEMGNTTATFDEPRYVFAINNERDYPTLLDCRVFVDGILVMDLYQERKLFMDYLYIPSSMVTDDSYIEIEVFPYYSFSQKVNFASIDDEKEITLVDPEDHITPTLADIYYIDDTNPSHRYDKDFFDITQSHTDGDFLVTPGYQKKEVKFTRLSNFKIKPNSETVVGVNLTLTFSKIANGIELAIDTEGFPYLQFTDDRFNFNYEYLRIFRNGRLLPRCKYTFMSSFGAPRIMLLDYYEKGEIIYIDITPFRYKEVYYKEELTEKDTIIDLKGYITKPFDIKYYDVYMNGRKLSGNNAFTIDPWQLTLVNLKSNYNLTIYEKDRDWEYFGLDYNDNIYYYSHEDLFSENFVTEDDKNAIIKEIIDTKKDNRLTIVPNTNDEEKMDYTDITSYVTVNSFYNYELIPKTFLNPDVLQENSTLVHDDYIDVYENYRTSPYMQARGSVEALRKAGYRDVLFLDPDVIIKGESEDNSQLVYAVGHLDDDVEEYLDQTVVIDNTENID